jgi:hypothetical protein
VCLMGFVFGIGWDVRASNVGCVEGEKKEGGMGVF